MLSLEYTPPNVMLYALGESLVEDMSSCLGPF
jgi:hypothetical protein